MKIQIAPERQPTTLLESKSQSCVTCIQTAPTCGMSLLQSLTMLLEWKICMRRSVNQTVNYLSRFLTLVFERDSVTQDRREISRTHELTDQRKTSSQNQSELQQLLTSCSPTTTITTGSDINSHAYCSLC